MDHQALDEGTVVVARQPVILVAVPISLGNDLTFRGQPGVAEIADGSVEGAVRKAELGVDVGPLDCLVPALHTPQAVVDVFLTQPLVDGVDRGMIDQLDLVADDGMHRPCGVDENMIIALDFALMVAALEALVEVGRGVGGNLLAK